MAKTKETELIRVQREDYEDIAALAAAQRRSLGGQVGILVKMACAHPLEYRKEYLVVLSPVMDLERGKKNKVAKVGEGRMSHAFKCAKCGMFVVNPEDSSDVLASTLDTVDSEVR